MQPFITVLLAAALFQGQAGGGEDRDRVEQWKKELCGNWNLAAIPDFEAELREWQLERPVLKRIVILFEKEIEIGRLEPKDLASFQCRLKTAEARIATLQPLFDVQNCWILAKKLEARQQQKAITTDSEALTAHQISVCRSLFEFAFVMAIKSHK